MTQGDDRPKAGPAIRQAIAAAAVAGLAGLVLVLVYGLSAWTVPLLAGAVWLAATLAGRGTAAVPAAVRVSGQAAAWPDGGMKALAEAVDHPCFLVDAEGNVRYQNRAAGDRFGAVRAGDPLSLRLRSPDLVAAVARVSAGAGHAVVRISERVPTERQYAVHVSTVRNPRREAPDFVLVRLQDETEIFRTERMRVDFVANASHELRTPLAALTGFIETLQGPARNDPVNRDRFLAIMLEQAQRMARLIDDLLSLSRIELKAHVRPQDAVALAPLLAQAVDFLQPLAREQQASLSLSGGDALVDGDRDELFQVVVNLVENGLKYGRTGGHVAIVLTVDARNATIEVADDGPGIAPEHLPRLTERFYRIDTDRSRRQKGTGLGLAIVKHIVNRHRGQLQIRSVVGSGTTVSVALGLRQTGNTGENAAITER